MPLFCLVLKVGCLSELQRTQVADTINLLRTHKAISHIAIITYFPALRERTRSLPGPSPPDGLGQQSPSSSSANEMYLYLICASNKSET